nr:GNAT family N-acetyltransferase [uncultured Caproiciproducens sp.]
MEIRKAVPGDMAGITILFKSCTAHMVQHDLLQWDELYPNTEVFAQDIKDRGLYVCVTPENCIIGCVVLNRFQDKEYEEVDWEFTGGIIGVIHRLMVLPEYEGTGIAHNLLVYAETCAGAQGMDAIRLDAFPQNQRAIAFYKKHGYRIRGSVNFRKGLFVCCEKSLICLSGENREALPIRGQSGNNRIP